MAVRIVALAQQKGGVGKSSVAINLACQAHLAGKKVALIDMDKEQGSSLKWGERRGSAELPKVIAADAFGLPSLLKELAADATDWAFIDLPGRNAPAANAGLVASDF